MDTPEIEVKIAELLPQLDSPDFKGDGVDPVLLFAAKAEKRRRDTQASFTRSQQELKQVQAVNEQLAQTFEAELVKTLPVAEAAELEELKHTDPDAWRTKLGELEQVRRTQVKAQLDTIATEAKGKTELELRIEQLQAFNEAYPDVTINDEVIENDIPPRITRKLAKGDITFAAFLEECRTYLAKGKVIDKGNTPPNIPDLSAVPGSSTPGEARQAKAGYEQEIY